MFDQDTERIDFNITLARFGVAEKCLAIGGDREARPVERIGIRGNAAVCGALIAEIFIAQGDEGFLAGLDRSGRVDALTLERIPVAETFRVLVHTGDAEREGIAERMRIVGSRAALLPRAELQADIQRLAPIGGLGHAVQQPTGAAAAEDHRVRTLERFDALDVVGVAVVLHIIAHAVDEEIRGRTVAAEHQPVAIAFALGNTDARHVAHRVGHALHSLVPHLLLGDHADRLRHILQRGIGFRGAGVAFGLIGVQALAAHTDGVQIHRFFLGSGHVGRGGGRGCDKRS